MRVKHLILLFLHNHESSNLTLVEHNLVWGAIVCAYLHFYYSHEPVYVTYFGWDMIFLKWHLLWTKEVSTLCYLPINRGTWFLFLRIMIAMHLLLILIWRVSVGLFPVPSDDLWDIFLLLLVRRICMRILYRTLKIVSISSI